jgi:hypothetical protein
VPPAIVDARFLINWFRFRQRDDLSESIHKARDTEACPSRGKNGTCEKLPGARSGLLVETGDMKLEAMMCSLPLDVLNGERLNAGIPYVLVEGWH